MLPLNKNVKSLTSVRDTEDQSIPSNCREVHKNDSFMQAWNLLWNFTTSRDTLFKINFEVSFVT